MVLKPIKILLVEDNPGDARLIQEMLFDAGGSDLKIEWVPRLAEGLKRLAQEEVHLVLLDLGLPDSQGLDTFIQAYTHAPEIPFVVLSGLADETLAVTAVRRGAQDYLVKGEVDGLSLLRAIRYATERKHAEETLKGERERLFSLLDSLPAFVYLIAPDFSIRFANRRYREIFGTPEGKNCFEITLRRSAPCEGCPLPEVLLTQKPRQLEITCPHNGRIYQVYAYPFAEADGSMLALAMGLDITEGKQAVEALRKGEALLRESEAKYRLLVEQLPAITYIQPLGEGNTAPYISPQVQDIFGFSQEEVLADPGIWNRQIYSGDRDRVLTEVARCHATAEPFSSEYRLLDRHGNVIWVRDEARIFRGPEGQPLFLQGLVRDITRRKQWEEALKESEQDLRYLASQLLNAQEQERKRISRELHDELGQALLVLKLRLRSMGGKLGDGLNVVREDYDDLLRDLDLAVDNVRRLSRDLSPALLEDLGLSAAIRHQVSEFSKHYDLEHCLVEMDEIDHLFSENAKTNIYRILQESLTNIGKYAGATSISVSIKKTDGWVAFTIADNGCGFDVAQTLDRSAGDQGLGLAAIKERVRMLRGALTIDSAPGKGTQISFAIPGDLST